MRSLWGANQPRLMKRLLSWCLAFASMVATWMGRGGCLSVLHPSILMLRQARVAHFFWWASPTVCVPSQGTLRDRPPRQQGWAKGMRAEDTEENARCHQPPPNPLAAPDVRLHKYISVFCHPLAMRWPRRMAALVGVVVMVACVGGDAPGRIAERREGSEIDGRLQGPRRKLLSLYIGSFRVGDNPATLNPTFGIYPTAHRWVGGDVPLWHRADGSLLLTRHGALQMLAVVWRRASCCSPPPTRPSWRGRAPPAHHPTPARATWTPSALRATRARSTMTSK